MAAQAELGLELSHAVQTRRDPADQRSSSSDGDRLPGQQIIITLLAAFS